MLQEPSVPSAYEAAVQYVDNYIQRDHQYKELAALLSVGIKSGYPTVSGLSEVDYPHFPDHVGGELSVVRNSPLPADLMEKFGSMQRNCLMGLFPEAGRVWLTIDHEIFIWNFEDGTDLAYYNGLQDTIIAVRFVKPKCGVFSSDVQFLLCLATPVEVVLLGVTLGSDGHGANMHLMPLHRVVTDNQTISCIEGNHEGRIFLGTRSGCVLEIVYGTKTGWFSLGGSATRTCQLVNHSISSLSMILPNILTLGFKEEDGVVQLCSDAKRNLLYARTEHSALSVFSTGTGTNAGLRRLTSLSESSLVSSAGGAARSVDRGQFKGLVHLCPLSEGPLHAMAITRAGVRLYFGQNLSLVHVRLPPPGPGLPKVNDVRLACESRGTVLLVCSRSEDADVLYTLSPDPFPWSPGLAESCSLAWPPGRAWVLQPIDSTVLKHDKPILRSSTSRPQGPPPVTLTQHIDPVRRFLLVSAQGLVHLELPSPLQQLADLLSRCPGPDSMELRSWFLHFGPEEAVYAGLVLASDKQDPELAEKAKQAVFLHCNDAVLLPPAVTQPMSTPIGRAQPTPQTAVTNPIHMGLAVYAARILRPLWDSALVEVVKPTDKQVFLVSRWDTEELSWFLHHLVHLRDFIRDHLGQLRAGQQVTNQERTTDLLELLGLVLEVLGLWKLLTEHQFYLIARRLARDHGDQLCRTGLRQLVGPGGRPLLGALTTALLEHYISDGAGVELVANKLQSTCPTLFGSEDALCARASHMLAQVSLSTGENRLSEIERSTLLAEAVSIFQAAGPNIDLEAVLTRLEAVGCYSGMVQLCLSVARSRDPEGRALACLREGHRPHDEMAMAAVDGRYDAYRRLLDILTTLLDLSRTEAKRRQPQSNQPSAGDSKPTNGNAPEQVHSARAELTAVLVNIFKNSDDILVHYEVLGWLLSNNMSDEALSGQSAHLESYLRNRLRQSPDDLPLRDLLWRHCEREGKRLEAARVLDHLATAASDAVNLEQRIDYLSRAIVCVKALAGVQDEGDYLQELEDKLEIAHLQKRLVEELRSRYPLSSPDTLGDQSRLDYQLFPLTTLFSQFAERYRLLQSKLCILRAAGHTDSCLVEELWEELLERECSDTEALRPVAARETKLRDVLLRLATRFRDTPAFFPLEVIVHFMEQYSFRSHFSPGWTVTVLMDMKIEIPALLHAYNTVLNTKDPLCQSTHFKKHLFEAIIRLLERFMASVDNMHPRQRQMQSSRLLDLITNHLLDLQSTGEPALSKITARMRQFKVELERFT